MNFIFRECFTYTKTAPFLIFPSFFLFKFGGRGSLSCPGWPCSLALLPQGPQQLGLQVHVHAYSFNEPQHWPVPRAQVLSVPPPDCQSPGPRVPTLHYFSNAPVSHHAAPSDQCPAVLPLNRSSLTLMDFHESCFAQEHFLARPGPSLRGAPDDAIFFLEPLQE